MNKNLILIIDFGQTHVKFFVLNKKIKIVHIKIFKNNFILKKKIYDLLTLQNFVIDTINNIIKKFNVNKISYVTHGSSLFYVDSKGKIKSGYTYNAKIINTNLNLLFSKIIPSFDISYTHLYGCFNNLGKNFFFLKDKIINFLTFPSFLGFILTKKNIIDYTYLGCHSFLWNFKKKKINFFFKNKIIKKSIIVKKPGTKIGNLRINNFSKNHISVFNGMHDTSAAFFFHNNFFKNGLFISSGTTCVIGSYLNNKFIKIIPKYYYFLQPYELESVIVARKFKNKYYQKKTFNADDLYLKLIREIDCFIKLNKNIHSIVIDGPFIKNKSLINKIKKNYPKLKIYIFFKQYAAALGIASIINPLKYKSFLQRYYKLHN